MHKRRHESMSATKKLSDEVKSEIFSFRNIGKMYKLTVYQIINLQFGGINNILADCNILIVSS